MNTPEKVIAFSVYSASKVCLGIVDVELPSVEFMTDTISGAGIAGELESPVIGHTKALGVKLKFRSVTRQTASLLAPVRQQLDLRASVQSRAMDKGGDLVTAPQKIVIGGMVKKHSLGKLETAKAQDCEVELDADYLKLTLDGEDILEVDKFAMVFKVNGTDYLAAVRSDIGMEG
ncbi:phage major tail tube protein [Desulfovibrio mangrovi]|uniref:phage major tail tube protein n=1 Tax=Desulfovibrio mangrovi TaxID=2976983 RepID=UPI002245EDA6|nr:phage major tail tube protein [Desulfovibrio mangrovi]UZP67655.1 phage major tail tube protein [Desulfovibrio mangrovi]